MEKRIGCCGFKCHICAAYEENIHSEEERKDVCDKWKHYFDYELDLQKMHCNGCCAHRYENDVMIHGDCQYRKCVIDKGIEYCHECSDYPCEKLSGYHAAYRSAYENLKDRIKPGDEEGYFLTYLVD